MTDEDVERNLQSMAELAKANGIKVVLASIMPTSAYHGCRFVRGRGPPPTPDRCSPGAAESS